MRGSDMRPILTACYIAMSILHVASARADEPFYNSVDTLVTTCEHVNDVQATRCESFVVGVMLGLTAMTGSQECLMIARWKPAILREIVIEHYQSMLKTRQGQADLAKYESSPGSFVASAFWKVFCSKKADAL